MSILYVIGAMLSNLLTAALVPLVFLYSIDHVVIGGYPFSFVEYGFWGMFLYMTLNALSAHRRPPENVYFHMDLWPSLMAAISIWTTAALVFMLGHNIAFVATIPGAEQQLSALAAFAVIDMLVFQRSNARVVTKWLQSNPGASVVPVTTGDSTGTQDVENAMEVPGVLVIQAMRWRRADGSLSDPVKLPRVIEHEPLPSN